MQRLISIGALLLIIQIGLVAAIALKKEEFSAYAPNERVAGFNVGDVDTLAIKGEEGELTLQKKNGIWLVAPEKGVPADNKMVEAFLGSISGLKRGLAVGTSEEAAKRFKVSENVYGHHLVLSGADQELANLYFGTSPGYKKIHLRANGSGEIITASLSSHELSPKVEQWIDKEILKIDKEEVKQVKVENLTFMKDSENKWVLEENSDGLEAASEQIIQLLEKLCSLSVHGVVSEEQQENEEEGSFSFAVTMDDGKQIELSLNPLGEESYAAKRSDLDYIVSVSKWQVEEIQKMMAADFSKKETQPAAEEIPTASTN